jgi:hypothetical protein
MSLKIILTYDMTLYRFWIGADVSEEPAVLIYPEDGDNRFLRNVGIYQLDFILVFMSDIACFPRCV